MTLILFGQYLDIFLTLILTIRVFRLKLEAKYVAWLVFVVYDSVGSVIYLVVVALIRNGFHVIDYRILWFLMETLTWATTIWLVYSLLIAILRNLPGILRFSLRFLNLVFAVSICIAALTIRPEYAAYNTTVKSNWLRQLSIATRVIGRSLSLAELLSIFCVLVFVLRFPMRVPRNLAALSAGVSVYLVLKIGIFLAFSYLPAVSNIPWMASVPSYSMAACLVYWIFSVSSTGEEAVATLGRNWQTVPRAHLVRQLEAMDAALLRAREQP
jgi:hypothetical protein